MTKEAIAVNSDADLALQRFAELWKRSRDGEINPQLVEEVLEELSVALHELQAGTDELREQHQQLMRTETRLSEERRRYQELFEFGPDGYLVTTSTGVIREANRMAAKLLGVSQTALFGKPLAVFIHIDQRRAFRVLLNDMAAGAMTTQTFETGIVPRRGG